MPWHARLQTVTAAAWRLLAVGPSSMASSFGAASRQACTMSTPCKAHHPIQSVASFPFKQGLNGVNMSMHRLESIRDTTVIVQRQMLHSCICYHQMIDLQKAYNPFSAGGLS